MSFFHVLSLHNEDNTRILQNPLFSILYSLFLFNICMSIHPLTIVSGVLNIPNKFHVLQELTRRVTRVRVRIMNRFKPLISSKIKKALIKSTLFCSNYYSPIIFIISFWNTSVLASASAASFPLIEK